MLVGSTERDVMMSVSRKKMRVFCGAGLIFVLARGTNETLHQSKFRSQRVLRRLLPENLGL